MRRRARTLPDRVEKLEKKRPARWPNWPYRCHDEVIDGQEVTVIDTYNERGEHTLRCIYPRGV